MAEVKLRNSTGAPSKIGYLVKSDTRSSNAFVYCGAAPTDVLGVVTEVVAPGALCTIATMGSTVSVYVKKGCKAGDTLRAGKNTSGDIAGVCVKALPADVPYFNIGTALGVQPKDGLVLCSLNFYYLGSGSGSSSDNTFETVSKNLKNYPYVITYDGDNIDYITYTTSAGTIVKTFNYTLGVLTSLVLSGATPSGIKLTKTLIYTGDSLTSVAYS